DIVTGVNASFIKTSLDQAGIDLNNPNDHGAMDINEELGEALQESNTSKPWRDIWSAGQGVGSIQDIPSVHDLVDRLIAEYQ
ncbi:MAG: nitronate monooxygenase, partial [Alphaproteobacteria bacterium]